MKRRKQINRRRSRKYFSKNADKTHYFNVQSPIMRGGIRM